MILAVMLAALPAVPAAAASNDPFPLVGKFALGSSGGPLLAGVDPGLRALVAAVPGETVMYLADTDRLGASRAIRLPYVTARSATVDAVHHRAFVAHNPGATPVVSEAEPPAIGVVDLRRGAPSGAFRFPERFRGHVVDALGYYPPDDLLYAITDVTSSGQSARQLFVHAVDAHLMTSDPAAALVWSYEVDSCSDVPESGGRFGFVHRSTKADFLYFACDPSTVGPSNGIVRLDIPRGATAADTSRFSVEFAFFSGGLGDGFVAADPEHDRILVFASAAGKEKFYVFDAFNRAWVGSVPLGNNNLGGVAFDPGSGRIYASQQPNGVLVTEGAWLPIPQGQVYPTAPTVRFGHPAFDPVTRRLFVPSTRTKDGNLMQDAVLVYEDRMSPMPAPALEDPDVRTQAVTEVSAETQQTFSGGGSAYGARYIFTGGVQNKFNGALWRAVEAVSGSYVGVATTTGTLNTNPPYKPGGAPRSLFLGRVRDLFIDEGTASAKSIADDADPVTLGDIAQLRDSLAGEDPLPHGPGDPANEAVRAAREGARSRVRWPYQEASCVDFGNSSDRLADAQPGATTRCDHETPAASAAAASLPEIDGLPVSVGYARSTVEARRDSKLGMVSVATAVARQVDVGGLLRIGEVTTRAEARAFGRPGTTKSIFTTSLKEVVIRSAGGDELYACGFGDASCDLIALARAADRYLPTRIHVGFGRPEPDPRVAATPRGAQALVAKSAFQFWSDFNSNGVASYEVPGLVITSYDDAFPHILQLAGVSVDAHYTVSAPGEDGDGSGDGAGGSPFEPPAPPPYPSPGPRVLGERIVQGPTLIVTVLARGVHLALTSPRQGALLALLWLLAALPVYLAMRRRTLRAVRSGAAR
jgi:hypothetical protein